MGTLCGDLPSSSSLSATSKFEQCFDHPLEEVLIAANPF